MALKLIKNGSQNKFERHDTFSCEEKNHYRECDRPMPAPNTKNTYCKDGPLKPTRSGKR